MSDTFDPPTPPRRPHSQPLAVAYLEFDLAREIGQLHREPEWENGKNAKTLVKYDDFHVVLTTLRGRARMPGHQTEGRISIQTVHGHLQVRADGRTLDLPAGQSADPRPWTSSRRRSPEDSALLLTIA